MGNCVSISISCDSCMNKVSEWLDEKGGYTHNLEKNLTALKTSMEDLKAKRDDLSRRVTREEDRGLQRLAEIQVWFDRVETVENRVIDLLSTINVERKRLCFSGFCSKSLVSSYRYGKRVFLALREVEKLKSGVFEIVTEQAQTFEVQERQLQPVIVGQEKMLDKAWNSLLEDGVGIMGLYGMGGVGKTMLLTQINNKFSENRCGFDFVIWVVVSKELQVEKIQDEIAQKVGLFVRGEKAQKADAIYNFLRKKRFVLFLDDIWQKVDLAEIGIPFPTTQNRCKVVFTTRSQDVCARMGVERPMKVQCLADNEAFELFQKKVGQVTLGSDPEIPDLARIVARKCRGLPLALNVIGETMSCKRTVQEWHYAIEVLTSYAAQFSGMEDEILPILKYSYDNLKGKQIKPCFLYCALFPEDDRILKEKLIGYWIGEGIIYGSESREIAENNGYEIISSLVRSSLLMEEVSPLGSIVCMHDVVREMALWIASDLGNEKEAFIVHAGVGLRKIPKVKNWNVVQKMSLMNNELLHLAGSPECLELTTMLLQNSKLAEISTEFFKFMPKLAVLDLSGNPRFSELPDSISELGSLQYLNLSWTDIRQLPMGLRKLKKLFHLDLEADKLSSIVGISSLHNLKILNLSCSWDRDIVELGTLEHLEILIIGINLPQGLDKFLSSHWLTSCTRSLRISKIHIGSSAISLPVTMKNLRDFIIGDCSISEIKMGKMCNKNICFSSLSLVFLEDCKCLKEMTFLMFAPNLKELKIVNGLELEDIINKEKACVAEESGIVPFPKLNRLVFYDLPELKNIYWSPLPFQCLKVMRVLGCPNLKKLPLNSQSGKDGEDERLIIGYREREWIEGVEWEDEATKTRFLSSCEEFSF